MSKGLPKSIIKKYGITKKAWRIFKGNKRKPYKPKSSTVKQAKRRKRSVAKKRRSRRRGFGTQTIFKWLRIGSLIGTGAIRYTQVSGDPIRKLGYTMLFFAGMGDDNKFHADHFIRAWTPFVLTTAVTIGIGKLSGILRRL